MANSIPACLGGQATTTYTETCDKDDELILRLVYGPHAVFGSGRISRDVEEQEERTGMEGLGGVCSKCFNAIQIARDQ